MSPAALVTLNMRELDRLKVIQAVVDMGLKPGRAAGYFEATRAYLERHGKPVAFYSDRASVFHVKKRAETAGKGVTQFGLAMYELTIDTFCANSSPAKGRVERAHLTLQARTAHETVCSKRREATCLFSRRKGANSDQPRRTISRL
ncbi:hypothetical protein LMG28727_06519 [Paraburkholderia kirstenboschensis]|nr:hypothetical protein LMG28727_06519 [Paraburkholderia kirstenboschensis]